MHANRPLPDELYISVLHSDAAESRALTSLDNSDFADVGLFLLITASAAFSASFECCRSYSLHGPALTRSSLVSSTASPWRSCFQGSVIPCPSALLLRCSPFSLRQRSYSDYTFSGVDYQRQAKRNDICPLRPQSPRLNASYSLDGDHQFRPQPVLVREMRCLSRSRTAYRVDSGAADSEGTRMILSRHRVPISSKSLSMSLMRGSWSQVRLRHIVVHLKCTANGAHRT